MIPRRLLFTGSPPLCYRVAPHPLASRVSMNASLIFPTPLHPPFSHGQLVWSLEYGYLSRYLSLWLVSNWRVSHRQATLCLVMQRALALVHIPPRHNYADITVALFEVDLHKKSTWATL